MEQGKIEFENESDKFLPVARIRVTTMGQEIIEPAPEKLVPYSRKCTACADKDAIIHDLKVTIDWMAESGRELLEYIRALNKEPLSDADRDLPGNERYRD